MTKAKEIIEICKQDNISLSEYSIRCEMENTSLSKEEIIEKMKEVLDVMKESASKGKTTRIKSVSGLLNGGSFDLNSYRNSNNTICGEFLMDVMSSALSCSEVNASMGKIVASPTAGSCGILPSVLIGVGEKYNLSDEKLIEGLFVAGTIGKIIMEYASVAGAEAGCQAECGSAAAMACGSTIFMLSGDLEKTFDGASIVFQNILGLVCDPIGELVEVPCANRNASFAVIALTTADLILSGMKSLIPFDEMVEAMMKVGKSMPEELRETGCGGTAGTDTAKLIKKNLKKY